MNINHGMIGEVKMYAASSVPDGWFECDGSAISRTTYSNLFQIIGTSYGTGDGSTTFNIPDFRSRAVIGAGTGPGLSARSLGDTGGEERHTLDTSEMPNHSHTGATITASIFNGGGPAVSVGQPGFNTGTTGGGNSHNNMQPYGVAKFIIKY